MTHFDPAFTVRSFVGAGGHVAALLQPRVPGRSDPGQLGHLLAAQAGRASPSAPGQSDVLRVYGGTAHTQEVRQLLAAALPCCSHAVQGHGLGADMGGGSCSRRSRHFFYQDKSSSTTWIESVAD